MDRIFFKRPQRLLNAADYTQVFDHVEAKISHNAFLILAKHADSSQPGRIGLIAAKKNLRLAVQRNRFKRVMRESFRHNQQQLQGYNLIVMARSGAKTLTPAELRQAIDQAWPRLCKRLTQVQTSDTSKPVT